MTNMLYGLQYKRERHVSKIRTMSHLLVGDGEISNVISRTEISTESDSLPRS